MSDADTQQEPSMEEILSSIRRIISEGEEGEGEEGEGEEGEGEEGEGEEGEGEEGGETSYVEIEASELVPNLDFGLVAEFVDREDQHQAVKEYRDRLLASLG